ncbi:MAG: DUF4331 domain-containing protein [Thermoanaerobaculia bacterium]
MPVLVLLAVLLVPLPAIASSHREAPALLDMPEVDGADFYMFRSYEAGRSGFVTLIADYNPMQDPFGGPNYFPLRDDAFYDIRIDSDGDAVEDLTFRFRFSNALPVVVPGDPGLGVPVPLPNGTFVPVGISAVAPFGPGTPPPPPGGALNWVRSYTVRLIRGPVDHPTSVTFLRDTRSGSTRFAMPFDNIGMKTIPQYDAYAAGFIAPVDIPNCSAGRLFVGQRKDPFAVNLGEFFDLVNFNPVGSRAAQPNSLANKNITSLELEVPTACLNPGADGVVAGWTTANLQRFRELVDKPTFDQPFIETGDFVQVSRLGNPLVNELDIALAKKNLFNASRPKDDAQFLLFFQKPTVPVGIQLVGGVPPPNNIPRTDLEAFFLKGLPGLNQDNSGGEVLRLNTNTPPVAASSQNNLGYLGGDNAGWPNGRRPGDDVVDVTVRVLEGALCYQAGLTFCTPANAPAGALPFTDQTWVDAGQFDSVFPYLKPPIPGAPNPTRIFTSFLAGSAGSGACTGVLTPNQTQLSISCTHDLSGATLAQIVQGATVVCAFPGAASPIQAVCPLSAAQLDALQKQLLTVRIVSPGGAITGPLQ